MRTRDIIRFISLIIIQVLVLNHVNLFNMANPYLYVIFILLLPFEISGSVLLFSAFAMGFLIDVLSNTWGMHTAALLFMAFLRPFLIKMMVRREEFSSKSSPGIQQMGFRKFYIYSFILIFSHHTLLYIIDFFSLSNPVLLLNSILLSSLFTLILVMISHTLYPDKQN